ncbi:MAG: glycosyl transferase, WecB/TagA/CpsF family [Thermoleophilia bacterium]|nr:glycosyl transferase, WecB/TagA/CpsF family [Thermoleophilia bacterium]
MTTPPAQQPPRRVRIIGTEVDAITLSAAADQVIAWADARRSKYVVCANVHVLVTAADDLAYAAAIADADLVTPDGVPLVWTLRRRGVPEQQRVYGPDLMLEVCERAARDGLPIWLHGATESTLALLTQRLVERFPGLQVAGSSAPPFRAQSDAEVEDDLARIHAAGARILFLALGAPKQELWAQRTAGRFAGPTLAVGAAFDFHAGTVAQAPRWMQRAALEWFYRLLREPRRLWRRYWTTNIRFLRLLRRDPR